MKKSRTLPQINLAILSLSLCCLFAGCDQNSQKSTSSPTPAQTGNQDKKPLAVKRNSNVNNSIPTKSDAAQPVNRRSGSNVPSALQNSQSPSANLKSDANSPQPAAMAADPPSQKEAHITPVAITRTALLVSLIVLICIFLFSLRKGKKV